MRIGVLAGVGLSVEVGMVGSEGAVGAGVGGRV